MSLSRAWTASWICINAWFNGRTLPGRVLIGFWCDYDNENLYFFRILADISVLLILAIIKYSYTAEMLFFGYAHWPWENCQENCFSFFIFFNKIQDDWRITCYSRELELFHWFVPRKHLTLDICWLYFGVILISNFCVVYIKKLVTLPLRQI